jgi:hypothetical protein
MQIAIQKYELAGALSRTYHIENPAWLYKFITTSLE